MLIAVVTGFLAGLLFHLSTLLPASYLYPLAWPVLGGGLAVYAATRENRVLPGIGRQISRAAGSGVVAAAVFLSISVPEVYGSYALAVTSSAGRLMRCGSVPCEGPDADLVHALVVNLIVVAVWTIVLAGIGGLLAGHILRIGRTRPDVRPRLEGGVDHHCRA